MNFQVDKLTADIIKERQLTFIVGCLSYWTDKTCKELKGLPKKLRSFLKTFVGHPQNIFEQFYLSSATNGQKQETELFYLNPDNTLIEAAMEIRNAKEQMENGRESPFIVLTHKIFLPHVQSTVPFLHLLCIE